MWILSSQYPRARAPDKADRQPPAVCAGDYRKSPAAMMTTRDITPI
jgi:hypothetical protein